MKSNYKKLQTEITIKVAKTFNKLNKPFYINNYSDWRGRIYTQSIFISIQGGDLSQSLINYYVGQYIDTQGLEYLFIYGANCYNEKNLSKKSISSRIDWIIKNKNNIINLDLKFILKAESIFSFISFCLTMRKLFVLNDYKIHLPFYLDATCSGIL